MVENLDQRGLGGGDNNKLSENLKRCPREKLLSDTSISDLDIV